MINVRKGRVGNRMRIIKAILNCSKKYGRQGR